MLCIPKRKKVDTLTVIEPALDTLPYDLDDLDF